MEDRLNLDVWLRLATLDKCCTTELAPVYSSADPISAGMR